MERVRATRLEDSRTNDLTRSEELDHADWTASNVTVTADAATAPDGATTADNLSDTASGAHGFVSQAVTVADDSLDDAASAYFEKKSSDHIAILGLEFTGGTTELTYEAEINLNGGETDVSNSPDAPTRVVVEDWGDFWRVSVVGANNSTGNTTATALAYPHVGTTLGTRDVSVTGDVDVWGAQLEDGASPSSYIATTSSAETRAADSASEDISATPQTQSIYVKLVERGASVSAAVVTRIGNTAPYVDISSNGTNYRVDHNTPSGREIAILSTAPSYGDVVELVARLHSDGHVSILQSINGGTVTSAEDTGTSAPLENSWEREKIGIGNRPDGNTPSNSDFLALTIESGVKTMDQMRSLADSKAGDLYSYYPGDAVDTFSRASVATYRDEDAGLSTASSDVIRDDVWVGTEITVDVSEALEVADTTSATMQVIAENLESAAFTDTVEALFEFGGSVTEDMTVTDVVTASMIVSAAIAEGMTFDDAVVLLFDTEVSEGVTVGDVFEAITEVGGTHTEASGIGDQYEVTVSAAGTLRTVEMDATIRDAVHIYAPIRDEVEGDAEIRDEIMVYAPFIGE